MQTSVEGRVPFLDHNLIEFSYKKIPYDLKLKWKDNLSKEKAKKINSTEYSEILDSPKYLLKEVGRKYLPSKIIDRKKVGFPVPLNNWFGDLEVLANDVLLNADWLKKGVLKDLIEKSKKEVRFGQILWMFINIQKFKNNYFEKEWRW
jgi:asparagine synthase (glutamine-hydrolysing)